LADAVADVIVTVFSVAVVIMVGCLFSSIIGFSVVLTVMLRPSSSSSSPSPSVWGLHEPRRDTRCVVLTGALNPFRK